MRKAGIAFQLRLVGSASTMLDDLHVFASGDPRYVALQGHQRRITVNVRIASAAIDDLPGVWITPSEAQRCAFVRHNLEAILEIAETLLERGEALPADCNGRSGLVVQIRDIDFAEYLLQPGVSLNFAAFDPRAQSKLAGRDERFA
jgi:hypothetical protein